MGLTDKISWDIENKIVKPLNENPTRFLFFLFKKKFEYVIKEYNEGTTADIIKIYKKYLKSDKETSLISLLSYKNKNKISLRVTAKCTKKVEDAIGKYLTYLHLEKPEIEIENSQDLRIL